MVLGIFYDQKGEKEKAESHYRKALDINNDFAPAANNLAWNLAERGIKIDEAFRLALFAREKTPEDPHAMHTLGWINYLLGHYWKAVVELKNCVSRMPDNPVFHYHLGMAYYKNKQYENAKISFKKAFQIDPNFKGADDAHRLLKKIETEGEGGDRSQRAG